MLKIKWEHYTITNNGEAERMRFLFKQCSCTAAAFDTETTGLSHTRDLPFLFQFGWYDRDTMLGWTFAIDLESYPLLGRQVIKVWNALVKRAPWYVGHNTTFDLHMLTNLDPCLMYREDNITDTQTWIRLGTDAVAAKHGGAPLALKDFAARYIDNSAKDHEHLLKEERTKIAVDLNAKLRKRLGWYKYQIDAFFKDKVHDIDDLPEDKRKAYLEWHDQDLPEYLRPIVTGAVDSDMISYRTLNRENVIRYGHLDIVWTLEAFDMLERAVVLRENLPAVTMENSNIYPIYDMERVGFEADKDYIYESKKRLKEYLITRRKDLCILAGMQISVGQHDAIKEVLYNLGLNVSSTDKEELALLLSKLKNSEGDYGVAIDFIETVQELRTLEKWYSTYIMRFITDLKYGNKLYTTINRSGAVSGRVTSDFQQFPKKPIKTLEGVELFHPRKIFKVPEGYKGVVYLDYSQIELRLQAMYTILVGEGDLNLCRAYMPYQCHVGSNSGKVIEFDYTNIEHIHHAYDWEWFLNEQSDKKWTPTDVHSATTKVAFDIDESDEHFDELRYIGKRVNFGKNYGMQRGGVAAMFPEYSPEVIDKINDAYYTAFPGVKKYHDYCYRLAQRQPYAQNLFGVKYYGVSGHNLINMLIQGTGAYVLKTKIPQIQHYIKDHGYKSKFQMQIHDELSFCWHPDDPAELFFEIKHIMEDFPDFIVPIVAEMEVTYTSWAEKKKVKNIDELKA